MIPLGIAEQKKLLEFRIPKSEIRLGGVDDHKEFGFLAAEITELVRDS